MKKKHALSPEEKTLFREAVPGTKRLQNDTITHRPLRKKVTAISPNKLLQEEGAVRHLRPDVSHFELKKLRRGDYSPELFLDLHGLTQREAKQELGALIAACRREHVHCACVMHGHGKHILKQQTPLWLAQHPDVLAFHQAPKVLGGTAALLVLIELDDKLQ